MAEHKSGIVGEFMHHRRMVEIRKILDKAVSVFWRGGSMDNDLRADLRYAQEKLAELGKSPADLGYSEAEIESLELLGMLEQKIPPVH